MLCGQPPRSADAGRALTSTGGLGRRHDRQGKLAGYQAAHRSPHLESAELGYDKPTGSATVFGDIPPTDMVRDVWDGWTTDRRPAAVKAVMNRVMVSPHAGRKGGPNLTWELKLQFVRDRTDLTGGSDAERNVLTRRLGPALYRQLRGILSSVF